MRVLDANEIRRPSAEATTSSEIATMSLEHELRLRRWARSAYVPAAERSDAWHPVILQEMQFKDFEDQTSTVNGRSSFVPLEPTIDRRIDASHAIRTPHFMKPAVAKRKEERLYAEIVPGEMYYT